MMDLKAETILKLRETIPHIAPVDYENYIEQAQRRVRRLFMPVYMITPAGMESNPAQLIQWEPRHVHFSCNGEERVNIPRNFQVLRQTRRHAKIYYNIIKKLELRINSSFGYTTGNLPQPDSIPRKDKKKKFKLNCTVAYFAAFLRVICDRNIIEDPNVSELCRSSANVFYTRRQENLSPRCIRKYFDDPPVEILIKVREELKLVLRYLDKLIDLQAR